MHTRKFCNREICAFDLGRGIDTFLNLESRDDVRVWNLMFLLTRQKFRLPFLTPVYMGVDRTH